MELRDEEFINIFNVVNYNKFKTIINNSDTFVNKEINERVKELYLEYINECFDYIQIIGIYGHHG